MKKRALLFIASIVAGLRNKGLTKKGLLIQQKSYLTQQKVQMETHAYV